MTYLHEGMDSVRFDHWDGRVFPRYVKGEFIFRLHAMQRPSGRGCGASPSAAGAVRYRTLGILEQPVKGVLMGRRGLPGRDAAGRQWDISTGKVIDDNKERVTPPSTSSCVGEWP